VGKADVGGHLESGLPAGGGDGGVEGLKDGAGPEAGGLLLRGRGLAGDARDGGLGPKDAGEGVRLLGLEGRLGGGRQLPALAVAAIVASGSRDDRCVLAFACREDKSSRSTSMPPWMDLRRGEVVAVPLLDAAQIDA
jgi:hypothetical protein